MLEPPASRKPTRTVPPPGPSHESIQAVSRQLLAQSSVWDRPESTPSHPSSSAIATVDIPDARPESGPNPGIASVPLDPTPTAPAQPELLGDDPRAEHAAQPATTTSARDNPTVKPIAEPSVFALDETAPPGPPSRFAEVPPDFAGSRSVPSESVATINPDRVISLPINHPPRKPRARRQPRRWLREQSSTSRDPTRGGIKVSLIPRRGTTRFATNRRPESGAGCPPRWLRSRWPRPRRARPLERRTSSRVRSTVRAIPRPTP